MADTDLNIAIYEVSQGNIQVLLDQETIWLSQRQLAELLETSIDNISLHLKNIYKEGELTTGATTEDYSIVQQEGQRQVRRKVKHYNLDAIISVAYRVNSRKGTQFRQWATSTLKEHLTRGYTINQQRFEQNAQELEAALKLVRKAAPSPQLQADTGRGLVEIISRYTQTFLWLQRYDEDKLNEPHGQHSGTLPTVQQASNDLATLKQQLMAKGEATDLFGRPRSDGLGALLGNLDQTAFGEPALIDTHLEFAIYVNTGLLKPFKEFIHPEYLVLWLNSPVGRHYSEKNTYGKGVSQGNLNLSLIRAFAVSVPPILEQRPIVAKVDQLMTLCDQIKTHLQHQQQTRLHVADVLVEKALT